MIAILGYAHEMEERIAQGWTPHPVRNPVMRAYGRVYYTMGEHDEVEGADVAMEPVGLSRAPAAGDGATAGEGATGAERAGHED